MRFEQISDTVYFNMDSKTAIQVINTKDGFVASIHVGGGLVPVSTWHQTTFEDLAKFLKTCFNVIFVKHDWYNPKIPRKDYSEFKYATNKPSSL